MGFIRIILFLFTSLLFFNSCQEGEKESEFSEPIAFSEDTIKTIYQRFQNQNLKLSFDTTTSIIYSSQNLVVITNDYNENGIFDSTIISINDNKYQIEKRTNSDSKCYISKVDSAYSNLGNLLIGSCSLEFNGRTALDTGIGVIYSTMYGEIISKGHQINSGRVAYSINGIIIPQSIRLELIDKF